MAGLIFNLVRFEVDGECAGHNKESLAINRLLVAIMTKKLPGFLALQLTTERRKWERENGKSMDIRSFLQNFSDLLSNKEVVDGNKYNVNKLCALCGFGHYSDVCRETMNMKPKEVIQKAKFAKLCLKCLKQTHSADVC